MSTTPLGVLEYAGPARARASAPPWSILGTLWRVISFIVVAAVLILFVTLRAAVLIAGVTCVLLGTVLLVLGGKRGAAEKLAEWRERTIDLLRLWRGDFARFFRRGRDSASQVVRVEPA